MEDMISRKAAIDALDKRFDDIPMEQTTEILMLRRDLRDLPSAQSEEHTGKRTETHACDLIKRQDAIDAVNSIDNLDAKARGGICFKLMGLPSAQPETKERTAELAQNVPNDELISRKAAIDALSNMVDIDGFRDGWAVSRANVDCMLRSLPSAKSEVRTQMSSADCISRQAAIDALKDRYYKYDRFAKLEELVWAINTVPSVQPEIIRCKECTYGEQDDDGRWYCRGFGCQVGNEDGSGFCADAERREE